MMAAWELGVRGYSVTVFEQEQHLGGLMQTIPAYRMTDADVKEDRARFKNLDVTWVRDSKVGRAVPVENLLTDGYQAVFVSIGTSLGRNLGVRERNLPGVGAGAGHAEGNQQRSARPLEGEVVIGGGDVAMDAVRSALRLSGGGSVTLVYHEPGGDAGGSGGTA